MTIKNFLDLPLTAESIHDGEGLCPHAQVFPADAFETPVRFLNYTILPPGASFGAHEHGDDNELYIVLEGEGIYTEDGAEAAVKAGCVMINRRFGTHAIRNTGAGDMRLLVLEIYNASK